MRSASEKLSRYRADGDTESLKEALGHIDAMIGKLGSMMDPGLETLSAAAYAADTAYQATGDEKYLRFAEKLASSIKEKLNTGPVSSGPEGAVDMAVLMDLYHITGKRAYKEEVTKTIDGLMPDSPAAKAASETASYSSINSFNAAISLFMFCRRIVTTDCAVRPRPSETATPIVLSPTSRPRIRLTAAPNG